MSYRHVQQLVSVREEFAAAQAAISHMESVWAQLAGSKGMEDITLSHVRLALRNIEATYITRLFADFELILKGYLALNHPGRPAPRQDGTLINRVARLRRMPDPIRDRAHDVRIHRNSAVHQGGAQGPAVDFFQALSSLNRFLVRL